MLQIVPNCIKHYENLVKKGQIAFNWSASGQNHSYRDLQKYCTNEIVYLGKKK